MRYTVVQSDTLVELQRKVNSYWDMGWEPLGGMTAIRERVSGPVCYFQAVGNFEKNGKPQIENKWKRDKG